MAARQRTTREGGFSLVEVIIAVVILAVGVLGLAGTTAYIVRQITLADLLTERAAARQTIVERLHAAQYPPASGADSVGVFYARWSVSSTGRSADVTLYTVGPGLARSSTNPYPVLGPSVIDTFTFTVLGNE